MGEPFSLRNFRVVADQPLVFDVDVYGADPVPVVGTPVLVKADRLRLDFSYDFVTTKWCVTAFVWGLFEGTESRVSRLEVYRPVDVPWVWNLIVEHLPSRSIG